MLNISATICVNIYNILQAFRLHLLQEGEGQRDTNFSSVTQFWKREVKIGRLLYDKVITLPKFSAKFMITSFFLFQYFDFRLLSSDFLFASASLGTKSTS